jgi:hypothetical protein
MSNLKNQLEKIITDFDKLKINYSNANLYSTYVNIMYPDIDYNIEVIKYDSFSENSMSTKSSLSLIRKISRRLGEKISYKKWKLA